MKKIWLIGVLLGGVFLALGITQCGGDATSSGALTACDGGAEAGCPQPGTPLPGGW